MKRFGTLVACCSLVACAGMSEEKYQAEMARLSDMNCPMLEQELSTVYYRDTQQISLIRSLQGQKGCEIKPIMAQGPNQAKEQRDRNKHWRMMQGRQRVHGRDLRDK